MANVKIDLSAMGIGAVEVDGYDVAPWTQRLEVSAGAGWRTEVRLSLVPPNPVSLALEDAAVTIHGPLREVLLNAGWTPPSAEAASPLNDRETP